MFAVMCLIGLEENVAALRQGGNAAFAAGELAWRLERRQALHARAHDNIQQYTWALLALGELMQQEGCACVRELAAVC